MRIKLIIVFFCGLFIARPAAQDTNRVTLMFVGDIMTHANQIRGARYSGRYDFSPCFQHIREEFSAADFVIGNLETTFSGQPYSGFPSFRAPDELAVDLKQVGFNCLLTANNHAFDGGRSGLKRTLNLLDSLQIAHSGTYFDSLDRHQRTPLVLELKDVRIALLNYTYGTNYFPTGDSAVISLIDKRQIVRDVQKADSCGVDLTVVFFHWGREYQSLPDKSQTGLAAYCRNLGVDLVVGSHPHVVQTAETTFDTTGRFVNLTAYSLGNFVSDYITPERTGGAILKVVLEKRGEALDIVEAGYLLTWVVRIAEGQMQRYYVVPADRIDSIENLKIPADQLIRLNKFLKHVRNLVKGSDGALPEYRWDGGKNIWYLEK